MPYSKSDIELLKSYQGDINKNATKEQIELIQSLYRGIFHRELNQSCSNCWADAVIEILIYDKNNMSEQKFQLKIGNYLIDAANDSMNCCHRDCTDEKAIYHLKWAIEFDKNMPGRNMLNKTLEKFSVMPENWQILINAPHSNGYDKLTVPEIKKLLLEKAYLDKDLIFKSKETLLEMLRQP